MGKDKLRRNWCFGVIWFYLVVSVIWGVNIHPNTAYASMAIAAEEQQGIGGYDLSGVTLSLFDGEKYYDYHEAGVTFTGKEFRIVPQNLPDGLSARCIGDAQREVGEHKVIIEFTKDAEVVANMEVCLKINKADWDMSQVENFDSNIKLDGEIHYLHATNLPPDVEIEKEVGNGVSEVGSHQIITYFKNCGKDASNYNDVPPMVATLTIVGEKDPNKLSHDESAIRFEDTTFISDGQEHSIVATGIPEDVSVFYTGNKKVAPGTYVVTAHFKGNKDYNVILDRTAVMTIVAKESNSRSSKGGGSTDGGSTGNPEPPENPEEPEHHIWKEWCSKNDSEHERECSHCGIKETQPHKFVEVKATFTDNQDGTHIVEINYECADCQCSYVDVEQKDCQYGDWQYIGNDTDAKYCTNCQSEQTRTHQHIVPADLTFTPKSPNGDGTHKLECSYLCTMCNTTVIVQKDEDCEYEITYRRTGINDTHIVVRDCKVCQEHQEEEGTCVATGELKLIKVNAQVYEYYDCGLCGDWTKRIYHTVHRYGPWEERDDQTHIRYCICTEARETENHNFEFEEGIDTDSFVCNECGYSKTVPKHNHGYGLAEKRNVDLMALIKTDAYKYEILNKSQIPNPDSNSYEYCSRYDFMCHTCWVGYSIYYDHNFVNGVCTRTGYCGGIAEPAIARKILLEVVPDMVDEILDEDEIEESEVEMEETKEDEVEESEVETDETKEDEVEESEVETDETKEDEVEESEVETDKTKEDEVEESEVETDKTKEDEEEL